MKISTTSRYGLRAMAYLAKTDKACSIREISREEDISFDYLEKIISKLRKAGLVKAKRGANGGYSLSRSPQKITVGEIIKSLEGVLAPIPCANYSCPREEICLTKNIWQKIQDVLDSTLNSITLSNLIDKKYE